ncbi:MAG: DUF3015 family protein [SAR324 cluster bacterium]|nr:DUF3015 family protein [SAR324 cluster bacterium]
MNLNTKKMFVILLLALWIPAMIFAQEEGSTANEGTSGGRGMMKMMDGMMGGRERDRSDGPRLRGPFSSSYSSYTTTNNTTSSGTSDCLWGGRNCRETFGQNAEQAIYIARTIEQISEDAARGRGQHLEALAQLMSCPPEQTGLFSKEVKGNYPLIFSKSVSLTEQDISYTLEQFQGVIARHEMLNELCQSTGTELSRHDYAPFKRYL